MPRLAIIGLGLIGGSVGLALKRAKLAELEVVGYDIERGVGGRARKLGAIDTEARSLAAAAEGAAIVMIATPILQARMVLEEIAPALGEGAVVTDTASTKREILRWAEELLPDNASFVGGHPIAGKERQGLAAADAALFEGRPWAITPPARSPESAVRTVENLVKLVGGNVVPIDAEEHDSYVAAVSHLPLMLSVALFSLVSESQAWPDLAGLAGPGFRDLTRLASGSPDMSLDICLTNRDNVVQWIDRIQEEMVRFRQLLQESGDLEDLGKVFFKAQTNRDAFLSKPPTYPEPEGARDSLTAGERMLSFMVGEYAIRRKKEMEELLEQRAESDRESRPGRKRG